MSTDSFEWLPFLLQTGDTLFPTGAYAHSLGLEEMVRLGVVHDESALLDFMKHQIMPALTRLELPFLRFAYEVALGGDIDGLCGIDREISAWKISRELREASIQTGVRRLHVLLRILPGGDLERFENRRLGDDADGHHLVVCALQSAACRVPLDAALVAYLYQTLSGACSAALKLIRIGQEGCQRVLRECLADAGACVRGSVAVRREDAGWFNPMLEIAAMRHENADGRLFIS